MCRSAILCFIIYIDMYYVGQGTCNHLIAAYCNQGNMSEAYRLLEFMKSINVPISEIVYGSLITGHFRAGDWKAAQNIISTLKSNNQEVYVMAYTSLMCAYAERGHIEEIRKVSVLLLCVSEFQRWLCFNTTNCSCNTSGSQCKVWRLTVVHYQDSISWSFVLQFPIPCY